MKNTITPLKNPRISYNTKVLVRIPSKYFKFNKKVKKVKLIILFSLNFDGNLFIFTFNHNV